MVYIYINTPVEFEKVSGVRYNIITIDTEKALVGHLGYCCVDQQWFLKLRDEYLVSYHVLQQIATFIKEQR